MTYQWVQDNLDVVFFFYGLSFIIMGIAILLQPKKGSGLKISGIFWLLAMFGLLHGMNELLDMWTIIRGRHYILDSIRWFTLVSSFIFLFEFGRRLFVCNSAGKIKNLVKPYFTFIIVLLIVVLSFVSSDFWTTGSTLARYLLAFPGGLMIGFGFFRYCKCEKELLKPSKIKKYFIAAGLAFFLYGIFGGLVVNKGSILLSGVINNDSFLSVVKIPVQVFRALCAGLSTWGIIGMLSMFSWEKTRQIHDALITREKIIDGMDEGILLIDRNFRILEANKMEKELYGGAIIGDYCYHATHNVSKQCAGLSDPCPLAEGLASGEKISVIHTHYDDKNNPVYVEITVHPVKDEEGEIFEFVHISKDITKTMKLEETLESVSDPLIVINHEEKITTANPMFLELTGYSREETLRGTLELIFIEEEKQLFMRNVKRNGFIRNYELEIYTKERNNKIPVSLNAAIIKYQNNIMGIVCVLRDLREIKTLQSQVVQSEKMAAVGQLAGGVAHEINNPLGGVLGFAQVIARNVKEGDNLYVPLKSIEREAIRCKNLVGDLLTFSRSDKSVMASIDLNSAIRSALSLVEARTKTQNIEIVRSFEENLPKFTANSNQVQQVIINLCNNAIDAMPDGGKIAVKTKKLEREVEITISDTGSGIPEEVRRHLFEPFFTTKEVGKGTGLGLSLVYEIIKKHNGTVEVESELNEGTTFRIRLPIE